MSLRSDFPASLPQRGTVLETKEPARTEMCGCQNTLGLLKVALHRVNGAYFFEGFKKILLHKVYVVTLTHQDSAKQRQHSAEGTTELGSRLWSQLERSLGARRNTCGTLRLLIPQEHLAFHENALGFVSCKSLTKHYCRKRISSRTVGEN